MDRLRPQDAGRYAVRWSHPDYTSPVVTAFSTRDAAESFFARCRTRRHISGATLGRVLPDGQLAFIQAYIRDWDAVEATPAPEAEAPAQGSAYRRAWY